MATTDDTAAAGAGTSAAEDYVMIDPATIVLADRNPAMLRVSGRGTAHFNRGGIRLLREACAGAGLISRTPWGVLLAQDPASGNPVLFLTEDASAQGVPLRWSEGGRRARIYLAAAFQAWKITIAAPRGTSVTIPLAPATRPTNGEPGVMLRADQLAWHTAAPRRRKPAPG